MRRNLIDRLEPRTLCSVSFATPLRTELADVPTDLAIGDLNGDGRPDLVATDKLEKFYVLLNEGGRFDRTRLDRIHALRVELGDFNDDGFADLVTMGRESLTVRLGTGDGRFARARTYLMPSAPLDVEVADFDGDGRRDLAAASLARGVVTVLFGRGDGTFGGRTEIKVAGRPAAVHATDLDGDDKADLIAVRRKAGKATVFMSGAARGFVPTAILVAEPPAWDVVSGDFNGDDRTDLVLAYEDGLKVYLGRGDGTFDEGPAVREYDELTDVVAADFDGDDTLDLAVTSKKFGFALLTGLGDGRFTHVFKREVSWYFEWFEDEKEFMPAIVPRAEAADFDGDGLPDLALQARILLGEGGVSLYRNQSV